MELRGLGVLLLALAGVRGTMVCKRVDSAREHLLNLGVSETHLTGRLPESQLSPTLLKHAQWIFKREGQRFYLTEQRLTDPLTRADFDWKRVTLPRLQAAGLLPAALSCFETAEFGYFVLETHTREVCAVDAHTLFSLNRVEEFIREMLDSFRKYDSLGVAVAQAHDATLYCFNAQPARPAFAAFADFLPVEGRGPIAQAAYALWKPAAAAQLRPLEGVTPKTVVVQASRKDTLLSCVKTLAREMSWWRREPSEKYQPLFDSLAPALAHLEERLLGPEAQEVTWKKLRRAVKVAGLHFHPARENEPQSPLSDRSSSSSGSSGLGSLSPRPRGTRKRSSLTKHHSLDTFLAKE